MPLRLGGSWLILILAAYGLAALISMAAAACRRAAAGGGRTSPVSLLCVVRNKERIVEGLVRELLSIALEGERGAAREVVVVDDHSTDDTPAILDRLARRCPSLRVVSMAELRAHGESALDVGVFMCSGPVVMLLNVGGQVQVRSLVRSVRDLLGRRPTRRAGPAGPSGPVAVPAGPERGPLRLPTFQGKEPGSGATN